MRINGSVTRVTFLTFTTTEILVTALRIVYQIPVKKIVLSRPRNNSSDCVIRVRVVETFRQPERKSSLETSEQCLSGDSVSSLARCK